MTWLDWSLIVGYFGALLVISLYKRPGISDESGFLLSGRTLTLPAFVATLVSTWYGGILGVGEFGYLYGISQWVVFGLPYYIFAMLFAWLLAPRIREMAHVTIPDAVTAAHGRPAGVVSAVGIAVLVSPAPYLLMCSLLVLFFLPSFSLSLVSLTLSLLIAGYVALGGFRAVVNTDRLQVVLMYVGFFVLIGFAWHQLGSPVEIWNQLPEAHRHPTGGHSISYLLVWFFIAIWTFVDPGFHQRCAAAKTPAIARKGILTSIGFWFIFDASTMLAALYGRVMLPDLETAALVYPEMATRLLPSGLLGLFFVGLLATIMSTLDSFMFLSGQTIGRDLIGPTHTRLGIFISAILAVVLIWLMPNVIDLWYTIGTVVIPGLLLPVLGVYMPVFRVRNMHWLMIAASGTSLLWMLFLYDSTGIEPFYPGMGVALGGWGWGRIRYR
jgi:SSS family solute:Na+ symporter